MQTFDSSRPRNGIFHDLAQAAANKTVYDFHTVTNAAAWQVVNDDVMGGVSTSSFRLTNGVALFHGKVSLENNGGFASARSLPAHHDLAIGDSFVIRVRGVSGGGNVDENRQFENPVPLTHSGKIDPWLRPKG